MAEPAKANSKERAMRIDTRLVQELAELLTANGLTEIEVEEGDRKIRVCRDPAPIFGAAPAQASNPSSTAQAPAAGGAQADEAAEAPPGETVKSPMVGTAFLSAEPSAEPFIAVGDEVKAGDTLLIVEAMKVMNPILAPDAGVVKKIMVSDGQPVEFDQPLVVLG